MTKLKNKKTSSADILGLGSAKPILKKFDCSICQKAIQQPRIEALKLMNVLPHNYTHTQCSQVKKIKGVYMGEAGTSEIKLCDVLYNDSVRSVFKRAEAEIEDDPKPVVEED